MKNKFLVNLKMYIRKKIGIEANYNDTNERYKELCYKLHRYCPDDKRSLALADWYYEKTGNHLDLQNVQTYNEKIQWFKLYGVNSEIGELSDKLLVRNWVQEKVGDKYLVPLLGTWQTFDEIDFNTLPDKFVLKCNHGCGYNIIVSDKSRFDIDMARRLVNKWLNENFAYRVGFEMQYAQIKPMIFAETYLENENNDLYDYKFWCFDGKVKYIQFLSERFTNGLKMAFYDTKWNKQNFTYSYPLDNKSIPKPANLDLMISIAEKLSKGFPHVRVDLYRLNNGTIYFGEMTFTSASGACRWNPPEVDAMMGKLYNLNVNESQHGQ